MNFTLFDGLQRHYKIQQAKVTANKNVNTLRNLELAAQLETSMAAITYNNALKSLATNKRNMELAKHVFEVSEKKFQQGVGNNLEIINAQTAMREAEINYFNSLYDAIISKIDYSKATGALINK
jgi:outer membrane protein TolC